MECATALRGRDRATSHCSVTCATIVRRKSAQSLNSVLNARVIGNAVRPFHRVAPTRGTWAPHQSSLRASAVLDRLSVLGWVRLRSLTLHHGRHMFISHALAGGRTLAEVRVAAGHSSLVTTSVYLHIAVEDDGRLGNLW